MKNLIQFKKHLSKIYPFLVCAFFIIPYFILQYFRQKLFLISNKNPYFDLMLGSFPNFMGGFVGTIGLAYSLLKKINNYLVYSVLIIGSFLTSEEFYPTVFGSNYFDLKDILAGWIGCFFASIWFNIKKI
jgi:hypothetical protein